MSNEAGLTEDNDPSRVDQNEEEAREDVGQNEPLALEANGSSDNYNQNGQAAQVEGDNVDHGGGGGEGSPSHTVEEAPEAPVAEARGQADEVPAGMPPPMPTGAHEKGGQQEVNPSSEKTASVAHKVAQQPKSTESAITTLRPSMDQKAYVEVSLNCRKHC